MSSEQAVRVRVAAIVMEDDRLLLVKHEKDGQQYWLLPGGGIDFGESVEVTLVRELWEETRLRAQVGGLVLINDSIAPDLSRHVVQLCFTAKVISGTPEVGDDPRVVDVAFVPLDDVRRLPMYPSIQPALVKACREGFKGHAEYLGNIWT